ncbi:MAG: IS21 family transposase, partial [Candidatus Eisenbacteria bacterium]
MPGRRIEMRKLKEVLRLHLTARLSNRKIALVTGVGKSAISKHVRRARKLGLDWGRIEAMDEEAISALLYAPPTEPGPADLVEPDWDEVSRELRRKKRVTKLLLWQEYKEEYGDRAYSYSRFCELYAGWKGNIEPVMRFEHAAGEKCFVDYAGQTLDVVDPETGEVRQAQVFVATLGASNYTFVDITWTQQSSDFLASHQRAVGFFGGVARIFVLDNLKSGVTRPDWYEPLMNRSYEDLLSHLNAVAIPGRVRKSRDKAKVENGVLQVERWVLAPLRNQLLIGLNGARTAVMEQLDKLNDRPFQKMAGSRSSVFEELDKPALQPLPSNRWVKAEWKKLKAHIDYHVDVDRYYFSVPYQYIGKTLDVKVTPRLVEIFCNGRPIASHARSSKRYTTRPEHMPSSHREYRRWNPPRVVCRAKQIGPHVSQLVDRLLSEKIHPEQGYRPCLGIVRLADKYGEGRLEAACKRALVYSAVSYKSVKSILEKGLDRVAEMPTNR